MPIAKKPTAVHRKATRKPRKRRAPGRPAAASPELRPRLLDAALACYVREGIAATTLRAIAREAGVTPALLHYYFGDAVQLRQAVVAERVLPVVDGFRSMLPLDGGLAELIAAFVAGIAALVGAHPWFPALWVREVLCEGGALREIVLRQFAPQIPQALAARFVRAQREGVLASGLDPRLLVVSLMGLTLFPAASAPIWRSFFASDDIDASVLREHTMALLDRGLGLGEKP